MSLFGKLSAWRESRRLEQLEVSEALWSEALGDWGVYRRYAPQSQEKLREMALRLLLRKHLVAAGDLHLSDAMRLRIAGMAVVPVLELGLDWYDGWQTLIIYDGPFVAEHSWEDEYGIVHEETSERSGEAWYRGPVILSWEDVLASGLDGFNVVIHELSHTLDMRREGANGAPPLHAGMDPAAWKRDMQGAWDDLGRRAESGASLPVDEYALEDPAEFFAVLSETFFEAPRPLAAAWPAVYQHLVAFYRQDPLMPAERGVSAP
ncbi:zinc-dependent peptidase [Halopseudomonas nanhaiensis]|uniref:M90 family metallopeptidase n=1 Tax=Halopseudomonas nanhaiensis TaxID=2830842 RepID=UPI001CBB6E23|nr:M90 family metallopeptidase [Halopseudomonas nanhaiensis]UAW98583.1 zinc-dependent peptidase [Halopseudomonas nanhaiensis]